MKTRFILILVGLLIFTGTSAQTPQAIPYQATTLNAAGQPLANHPIAVRFSILDSTISGDVLYKELHTISTNALGLFTANIGQGISLSGIFNTINWAVNNKFLKVELDTTGGGATFTDLGTQQLLSVPYALQAKNAENGIDRISVDGDTLYLSNGEAFVSTNSPTPNPFGLAIPTITISVLSVGSNSAQISVDVSDVNSAQITERGVVYSTSPKPKLLNAGGTSVNPANGTSSISFGEGSGANDTIIGAINQSELLIPNTLYYARAYAYTENGLFLYSNEVSFTTVQMGYVGPAGGVVFYDKGDTIGGWRYLEVAPFDQSAGAPWGCSGTYLGTGEGEDFDVGMGEINTAQIVAGCNEISFAAKICSDLVWGGQDDWFLPSIQELSLLDFNGNNTVGIQIQSYWSSNEDNDDSLAARTGLGAAFQKTELYKVRAIRAF